MSSKKDIIEQVTAIIEIEIAKAVNPIKNELAGIAKEIEVLKSKPSVDVAKPVESKRIKKEVNKDV